VNVLTEKLGRVFGEMTPEPPTATMVLLLVGSLLTGLSFAALLPPFEGFDETAHYSYIEQIAETGAWPRLNDPIAAEVSDYLDAAPGPTSLHARWSYRAFGRGAAIFYLVAL
jgi:hypothetical protein